MRNVSGDICVPYLQQNFCIKFDSQWSFELSGHDDEHISRLLIENAAISGLLVVINQSVHTIILKNIILHPNSILVVQKSVKELLLEIFSGTVHLYDTVQVSGPTCVKMFYGKLKVEESRTGKRTKIALEHAKLTRNTHLSEEISHIHLYSVEIAAGCSLKLHGSEQHISLQNCTGTVFFANIPGFERIRFDRTLQMEDFLDVIPVQVFLCTRTVVGEMFRLVLHFLQFEETLRLCDSTKDIILKNVKIYDECSLVVGKNFEQLTLHNCEGRVVIPGVSFNEGKETGLLLNGGQIRIVKLSDDMYDITAKNIQFTGDLAFRMRVHAAEICNVGMCADSTITFADECQSFNLEGNVACIRTSAVKTLKTLSLRGTDISNNSHLLAVPVERFTAENVTLHHRTVSQTGAPSALISLNITNCSTIVSIANTNVPVNITSIVRNVIRDESPLLTTPNSVFCLNEDSSVQFSELHLAHFHVHSDLEIVRKILSLSLKEITADSNSTIRVNKELESITIDNCLVNIDFTGTCGLRSIVLSRTAFIYNQVLHLPINYLNLSSIVIDQDVDLNESVKIAKLKDVRIEKNHTFKVNRNIHELDISGSVGTVNMSGIGGLDNIVLEQKHQIRVFSGKTPNAVFLYISDCHFNSNVVLPNDIGTVFLRNVDISLGCKLMLGNNCQHMVVESSLVHTELSRSASLKSVILKRARSTALETVLTGFSSVNKIIVLDMVVHSDTVLSIGANIVAVRFQKITCYGEFRDGEKCSEIGLLHCSGKYDFSKVALLKRLILIPTLEKTHPFVVMFPPLGHVEDLEIAYNFADAYFKNVLLRCVNLQRLTIHGLCLSDTNPTYSTPVFLNEVFNVPINDWQLEEKFTNYSAQTEGMYDQEEKKEIMSLKMNALVKIVFGFNMYSKLMSLKLIAFGLDGDNVKLLRKFKALQTLVVDYDFSDKMLFAHLPVGLMTLEITRRKNLVCVNPEPKTFDPIALEHLKKHENLRNLSLCGVLCVDGNIFQYLPINLYLLRVTWSPVKTFNKFGGNITKRVIKKFILCLNDNFNNLGPSRDSIRKQCRDIFNYLGQFILFDALEELLVEKGQKMVSLDTKTFKIK